MSSKSDVLKKKSLPSAFGGAMIIAGTTIGAGMLANPTGTSGVWFIGSIIVLICCWFSMMFSGLILLEVNLHFPIGASFNTIVKELLGNRWNLIIGLLVSFTMFCLMYAYVSVGGKVFENALNGLFEHFHEDRVHVSRVLGCILFTVIFACFVCFSKKIVERMSSFLMLVMIVTFVLSISGMFGNVSTKNLLNLFPGEKSVYWKYIWAIFPLCSAAYGYQGVVPSLVIYFKKDGSKVAKSIFWGLLIPLIVYIIWQFVTHGNLPRHQFKPVIDAGGDVVVLLRELSCHIAEKEIHIGGLSISFLKLIDVFAFAAIVSSFIGTALGLFDYVTDLFHFKINVSGKLKSSFLTFVPPLMACILFPSGFVTLIKSAGFFGVLWTVIVPCILLFICRKKYKTSTYRVPGGKIVVIIVLGLGLLNVFAQIFCWLGFLPVFKG